MIQYAALGLAGILSALFTYRAFACGGDAADAEPRVVFSGSRPLVGDIAYVDRSAEIVRGSGVRGWVIVYLRAGSPVRMNRLLRRFSATVVSSNPPTCRYTISVPPERMQPLLDALYAERSVKDAAAYLLPKTIDGRIEADIPEKRRILSFDSARKMIHVDGIMPGGVLTALVNGNMYVRQGDRVEGVLVKRISGNAVTFEFAGREFVKKVGENSD